MSVEIHPVGVKCNIKCAYCYENKLRDAGSFGKKFDLEKVKATVKRLKQPFSLFGGEALITPIPVLEELFKLGMKHKQNGVQTNGILITDEHVNLFRKYGVHIGFSIDGPNELNEVRCSIADTEKTMKNIELCRNNNLGCSIITTLSKSNATADRIPRLINWFQWLKRIGVSSFRLHFMETDTTAVDKTWSLSDEEMRHALELCYEVNKDFNFDIFSDVQKLLSGSDEDVTCIWNGCDYYSTNAVHSIRGDGSIGNCYRTGDGPKAAPDTIGLRQQILWMTPQEKGGCKDCEWFDYCGGNCPATGLNQDWRNRSSHCSALKMVFEIVAKNIEVKPRCKSSTVHADEPHGDEHGDHWDNDLVIGVAEVK